jgi:superfamily II DNA or RNA helicase
MAYIKAVEMFIIDEGHRGKSETVRSFLFEAENCMYRYAISATPWSDTPEDMKLLITAFGIRMIYEELPKVSMEKGYVKKVKYDQRGARPPRHFIKPTANFQNARDVGVLGNGEYNEQVIEDALLLVEEGRTVLLAVTEKVHCELLRKRFEDHGISAHVYHGKIPSAEKAEIIRKAKEQKKKNIFIATIAMGEGIDTTGVNCVMLIDIAKNSNRLIQFGGRGSRLEEGVEELLIVDYFHYYHPKLLEWSTIRAQSAQDYYESDTYMSDKKMKKTGLKFQRSY